MATVVLSESRRPTFADRDGVETMPKSESSVSTVTLDWADLLASGETISSAAWSDDGVTCTGETISGATTYATVTGTSGETQIKIVTSASRTLVRTIKFIDIGEAS